MPSRRAFRPQRQDVAKVIRGGAKRTLLDDTRGRECDTECGERDVSARIQLNVQ